MSIRAWLNPIRSYAQAAAYFKNTKPLAGRRSSWCIDRSFKADRVPLDRRRIRRGGYFLIKKGQQYDLTRWGSVCVSYFPDGSVVIHNKWATEFVDLMTPYHAYRKDSQSWIDLPSGTYVMSKGLHINAAGVPLNPEHHTRRRLKQPESRQMMKRVRPFLKYSVALWKMADGGERPMDILPRFETPWTAKQLALFDHQDNFPELQACLPWMASRWYKNPVEYHRRELVRYLRNVFGVWEDYQVPLGKMK